jgi:hypothetical protein
MQVGAEGKPLFENILPDEKVANTPEIPALDRVLRIQGDRVGIDLRLS